jgi:GTP-binding protein
MFVDRVKITVQGGDGGNGCVSFRREKFVPRGGPDGGNGGEGGGVILKVDPGVPTLLDLKYHPLQRAAKGVHGKGKDQHGRRGEDKVVPVPPGSIVFDAETGELLADLVRDDATFVAAKGGQGGTGNAGLTNMRNRLPRFSERGAPGECRTLRLELKIIADIAIVGLPNSGKSTLLSKITAANPRIDSYPFTTLSPNLGVVDAEDYTRFVVADIPGLIEGAHDGVGLGHDFLRHIERTKILVFLLDAGSSNPAEDYETLRNELNLHDEALLDKQQIIVANKMDLPPAKKNWAESQPILEKHGAPMAEISALKGEGLEKLVQLMTEAVEAKREEAPAESAALGFTKRYVYRPEFGVRCEGDTFVLVGEKPEKWAVMTDFENKEAVAHLRHRLLRLGIDAALKREGGEGSIVLRIGEQEFEYRIG